MCLDEQHCQGDPGCTVGVARAGRLVFAKVQPNGVLLYLGEDSFVLPTEWFDIRFDLHRDTGGKVESFTVDAGPASGILFERFVEIQSCSS